MIDQSIKSHVKSLRFLFHHFATGDMFRSLDRNSELGKKVTQYSSRGELVPDEG